VAAGAALRVLACLAVWPVGLGIDDSAPYTTAAAHNVLSDVQAPGGYPALLAALGHVTRQVAAVVVVQHLLGLAAAVLVYVAVRRATGSRWLGLLPAAGLLLDSDQIYLEHSVMAEGVFGIILAATLYAGVRALERPAALRWALLAGGLVGAAGLVRAAASAMILAVVLALALGPGPRGERLRAAGAALLATLVVLGAYAAANDSVSHEFSIGPKPGWHLYGMVAHYADCHDFTPPAGTRALCQSTPPSRRPGLNFYLYDPRSPAWRAFGYFGQDGKVGSFAREVVIHQPGAYLGNVGLNLLAYFVPSVFPKRYGDPLGGQGLSPPLDWTRDNPDASRLAQVMSSFYRPFRATTRRGVRRFLSGWERVFRFGATLLVITTLLTIAGLFVGERRSLLILFGLGGLSLLLAPSVIGEYSGRYTVPMVAPMLAAAAIAAEALWRRRHNAPRWTSGHELREPGAVPAPPWSPPGRRG
jgi:4-amino-4-deoxy-L-arabinose transferase-like glycosyltransferase